MNTRLLILWVFTFFFTSCQRSEARASLKVSPDSSQYFEYQNISISCEQLGPGEWMVWRYSTDRTKLVQCGSQWDTLTSSTCHIKTVKQSDSGVYWCESAHRDSSNAVNITISDKDVILKSPALPVMEGENVTLSCQYAVTSSNLPAHFYKDGIHISAEHTRHMTIKNVSKLNEGAYTCMMGDKKSPPSWLLMRDDSVPPSLTVSPDLSQLFEYQNLSLSCGDRGSDGWRITRFTTKGKMSTCGQEWGTVRSSFCELQTVKQHDSAIYWCESPTKQRSNSVNISVHDEPVILRSPVLPVKEGGNVTLSCQAKVKSTSNRPADFYKDGSLIRTESTGHMTLHPVTRSDEGLYRCNISGYGESPSSWLFVRALDVQASPLSSTPVALNVIRHIMVCSPYFISTIILVYLYGQKPTGRSPPVSRTTSPRSEEQERLDCDDVTADVTTEHSF